MIAPIAHASIEDVRLGGVLRDLRHLLREQGLELRANLAVLITTAIECVATTHQLDPTLKMHSFLTGLGTLSSTGTKQT